MRLRLKVLSYQRLAPGQQVEKILEKSGGSIGRSPTCDWRLPDPSRVVSGHHADIEFEDNQYYIVDRSTNGLFVNHAEAALGTGNREILNNGDIITLGEYEVEAIIENSDAGYMATPLPHTPSEVSSPEPMSPIDISSPIEEPSMQSQQADDALARLTGEFETQSESASPAMQEDLGLPSDFFEPPKPVAEPTPVPQQNDEKEWDANWLDQVAINETEAEPDNSVNSPPAIENTPAADLSEPGQIPDDWALQIEMGDQPDENRKTDILDVSLPDQEPEPAVEESHLETEPLAPAREAVQPAPTPVDTPKPQPANTSSATTPPTDAIAAFFEGFGYQPEKLTPEEQLEFIRLAGVSLRESIEGILETLKSRSIIKGEIQANQTMIGATENNPLKFSVNFEDAVFNMFEKHVHGFLSPKEAICEAMHDIKTHQVGLMAGTEAVLKSVLTYLDPEKIKSHRGQGTLLNKVSGDGKNWKEFQSRHAEVSRQLEENPQSLYAKEFAKAYEEQMEELKREAIRHIYQESIF